MGSMMRRGSFGDGATLDLAFTTMNSTADLTAAGFTFTRSTSATYINASGFVATASANQARFDYDPTSIGTPRGLLIEGSANNLATYSNDFSNAIWTLDTSGGTIPAVSTVSQTGPDGASTVTRITFNKTGGTFSRIRQNLSGTASQPYTMSVWMKANTASGGAATQNVGLRIGSDAAGFNCVVTTTWKRFQYTYALSGTNAEAQIMLWDNIVGNDETADVLVYGCQIEAGNGASSYIPTGASTGSRAADKCISDSISGWYTQGIGTVLVSARPLLTTSRTYWNFSAGASVPRIQLYSSGGTDVTAYLENPSGTGANIAFPTGSISNGTLFKAAWAFQTGSHAACVNGNAVATSSTSSPAVPTSGMTRFSVGHRYDEFNQFYGHIASVKYWPTRLANADLQALTA